MSRFSSSLLHQLLFKPPMATRIANLAGRQVSRAVSRQSQLSTRSYSAAAGENSFVAERAHAKDHAGKSADLWRKVSIYGCLPGSIVLGVYIYGIEAEHIHHRDHEIHENGGELPERTFYEYNNIRKRSFPWGPQSFFFNPKANYPAEEM